jgi:L-aspartate oxidase
MAFRGGAAVSDLEFVQFHPTALCVAGQPRVLLTEALRGEGALLRNARGERFLSGRLKGEELAPRDRVSRAIDEELRRTGGECVYLDLTPIPASRLETRFPGVLSTCRAAGIDPSREPIPVRPAAHYAMGGVETDLWARSTLAGLYAAGEVACAGVHGANRLASNSLLEGLVFGDRAARSMLSDDRKRPAEEGEPPEAGCVPGEDAGEVAGKVGEWMGRDVGLVRCREGLERALSHLAALDTREGAPPTRGGAEARNLALVARLIATLALWRRESRGAHFRDDYPRKARRFRRHSRLDGSGSDLRR